MAQLWLFRHCVISDIVSRIPFDDCFADIGGAGQVQLKWFDKLGCTLKRFDFGGEPRRKDLYLNARAEAYFTLADLCRMGHVLLPDDVGYASQAYQVSETASSVTEKIGRFKGQVRPQADNAEG